ncbi:MAG: SGNH/GDSL hydrolase family protein [Bacteroidetes bacterium]|nr:SGNH/GDSL hydrolase family protein [Bacteroidota bacterium]
MKYISIVLLTFIFCSFIMQSKKKIRYVALGDSYTICTGAKPSEAWPVLLSKHLKDAGIDIELIANPSANGFSTQNLIDYELSVFEESKANFVTLLIGVNDWVRNVDKQTYTKNLQFILDKVQAKLEDKSKILLITIPDFGVTPEGKNYGNGRNISEGINEFNTIIKTEAAKRKLPVVDIFKLSKEMGNKPDLVAADGLHPSAKEYTEWEKLIFPAAKSLLEK